MRKILVFLLCFVSILSKAQFPSGSAGSPSTIQLNPVDYLGWATGARPTGVSSRTGWNTDSLMAEVYYSSAWHQYWTSDKIKAYALGGGVVHGTKGNLLYYAPDGSAYTIPAIYDSANTRIKYNVGLAFLAGNSIQYANTWVVDNNSAGFVTASGATTGTLYTYSTAVSADAGVFELLQNTSANTGAKAILELLTNNNQDAGTWYRALGQSNATLWYSGISALSASDLHTRWYVGYGPNGTLTYAGRTRGIEFDSAGIWYKAVANLQNFDTTNNKIVVRNITTGRVGEMYWPTGTGGGGGNLDAITQGPTNHLFENSSSSVPTAINGQFWWNTSFYQPPNSNNAWTLYPGLLYDGAQGLKVPISYENNWGVAFNIKGNSIAANFGLGSANNGFVNKTAAMRGWGVNNGALSGSKVDGITFNNFGTGNGQVNLLEVGANDVAAYGYAGLANYIPALRNVVVFTQASQLLTGQQQTPVTPANWANYTIASSGNTTIAKQTLTNNSIINAKVSGTTVYVSVADSTTGNVTWTCTIDGVLKGTFTANTGSYTGSSMADCKRFPNLGDSMHLVSLQRTGGTGAFIVFYTASSFAPAQAFGGNGQKTYVTTVIRSGTNGSAGYVVHGGSDTAVYSYNKAIKNAIFELASDGLAVASVDIDKYYDPHVTGYAQTDSLHPADTGHSSIAQAVLNISSAYVMPQDREAIRVVNESITVDNTGPHLNEYFPNNDFLKLIRALGGTDKFQTSPFPSATSQTQNSGVLKVNSIYITAGTVITGIHFQNGGAQGNFTANNFNGFGLYAFDVSTGNLTLIAQTANDATFFQHTSNLHVFAPLTATFTTTYSGAYYIGTLCSFSANVTPPNIIQGVSTLNSTTPTVGASFGLPNSALIYATKTAQTSLPTGPFTLSTYTGVASGDWLTVY